MLLWSRYQLPTPGLGFRVSTWGASTWVCCFACPLPNFEPNTLQFVQGHMG